MSSLVIAGDTSGSVTLQVPAVSGSSVLSLPAVTGTVLSTANGVAHTIQRFLSGSGTYTTPANCKAIKVRMVGGGGGGGGGGYASTGGSSSQAGSTTFGTSLLTCTGGLGGPTASVPGTATVNSPAIPIIALTGSCGGGFTSNGPSYGIYGTGGTGGCSPFGGNAQGAANSYGLNAVTNSGSGGGGGGSTTALDAFSGAGGGSGGYIEALITSPDATYSYVVGAGSTGGTAGTSGYIGGNGGSGIIIVEEYYV